MSFRTRLGLFFLLIVVIPIALTAVLVVNVTADSQDGKADARIATGLDTALAVYDRALDDSSSELTDLLAEQSVADALASGSEARINEVVGAEADSRGFRSLTIEGDGLGLVEVAGTGEQFGAAQVTATGAGGDLTVRGSLTDTLRYADEVRELTGLDVALRTPGGAEESLTSAADLPEPGDATDITIEGTDARAASVALEGGSLVSLIAPIESGGILGSQSGIAGIAVLFLLAALLGVMLIARVLQSQIAEMLAAARRIGDGDFSRRVPVVGGDEMAGLAGEFNRMTDRLEAQIAQLRNQREELDRSIRRLGEAFASGLDRDALLAIVAETALSACQAEYARVAIDGEVVVEIPKRLTGPARDAAAAGQKRADREGSKVDARRGEGVALAAPLRPLNDPGPVGSLAIGRVGKPFDSSERDVFLYLIGQAASSIENIAAHEKASEEAKTDGLTGLPNNRAFTETIEREAARAARFGQELSLIILDIDNFKQVNDTHGHLQGDEVLRTLGKLLQEEPRVIDRAARYGGEEFVVALPETGPAGAAQVADRIREGLESMRIPLIEGEGEIGVTASLGIATMPLSAANVRDLFTAADEALYEAKRSGKNRVVAAPGSVGARK